MGDEAERLNEEMELREGLVGDAQLSLMEDAYHEAKAARVGTQIACPTCGVLHVKTTYHKVFCSNAKTKGRGNCKDRFWNLVDETRRARAMEFGRGE